MLLVSTAHDDDPIPVRSADVDETRATNKLRARDRRRRPVALVVDDSEDAQEVCGEVLQAEGFLVQTAPDGRDALDLLIDIPAPAIIILDILMPNMNGLELLDIIRSYRRLAETPVLLITAGDEFPPFPDRHTLFMQKPVDTAALKAGVRQLLASTNPA
jgi:CheY-like chemotaxis protein